MDNFCLYLSALIFATTFILIILERFHRTVITLSGAVVMIVSGTLFHFYSFDEAINAIDFDTLGLLMGMMIIVALLEETGFFQYLAILSTKKTKGSPWKLVVVLGTVTTLVSFILDNVTTVVLIAPVSIMITRIANISPVPILMAEALLSDTGGVATLVGDPPNVMIGSAAHFSFNDFLTHAAPIVLFAWLGTLLTLRIVFRKELKQKPTHVDDLLKWDEKKALKDPKTCRKILAILGLLVIIFFFHHSLHIPPAVVALIGSALALIVTYPTKDPQPILAKVEWSVLLFFAALFVLVGGMEKTGILNHLANAVIGSVGHNAVLSALLILWVSALASAIVDNIPFTIAMIPVIQHLNQMGVQTGLFWWALALGVGFGGNGSPIGSTANVVVVSKSEETDEPITFARWFKSGTAATIVTCMVASLAIILFCSYLSK